MKTAFISGKVTGDPDYRRKFADAEDALRREGYAVLSTAALPDGFSYGAYMRIAVAMLCECDTVFFLQGYEDSPGARAERALAEALGKTLVFAPGP